MKKISKKIIGIAVTIGFLSGLLGGVLTNEYLIAYLFDVLGGKLEGEAPIVKRVVEERVYVEGSTMIDKVEAVMPSVVKIIPAGVGFIVTTDGLIITGESVVSDSLGDYKVSLSTGEEFQVEVLKDSSDELAVLQIVWDEEIQNLPVVEFGESNLLKLGQRVLAVGRGVVTSGIVSSLIANDSGVFQTDAVISPGNLGGPLVNLKGEVIGVNSQLFQLDTGLSSVVPVSEIEAVLKDLQKRRS